MAAAPEASAARRGYFYALAAVVCFSTSAVFVLWAAPLSPFEIAVGRLAVASLWVMLLARLNGQPLWPARADLPQFAGFGLVTALHFLAYIASLRFTTIAHSLSLTYTSPIFVTLFSAWFLGEPITRRKWLGVVVAVVGIAVLAGLEPRMNGRMLIGDGLALVSAVMFGLYSVAGRSQRTRYSLFTYAGTVYGLAALWLLPAAIVSFTPAGYRLPSLLALLAAGLIPLGTGHTFYNGALRRLHATTTNLIATQEVTGGVILGALLIGQVPHINEIAGAAIALAGIVMVLIG